MTDRLLALLHGQRIGQVHRNRQGRLRFVYAETWRQQPDAFPLSLSLPLVVPEHPHEPIHAYLQGLLPDNDRILARWGQRFHVSARNPFGLLQAVGEDCAGAIQLVRPERESDLQSESDPPITWLTEHDLAERLRTLQRDQSAWRQTGDTGQFSLAGAQPKIALLNDGGRWGVPSGRTPTTHILKPPIPGYDGHVENEHLSLKLAHALGLPTAPTEVRRFEDEVVIVVRRYDRARDPQTGRWIRIHQEDLCQALSVTPERKYQSEGGPTPKTIGELLWTHSSRAVEDLEVFTKSLAFNWLIGGTDAHAKNYALLHAPGRAVRLAPLYDVASALPYDRSPQRLKLAMKIGSKYRLHDISARH